MSRKVFLQRKRDIRFRVLGSLSVACFVGLATIALSRSNILNSSQPLHHRNLADEFIVNKTEDCPEDSIYVLPYALIILYMFFALAIVVDDYFEPVISVISGKFNLSEDVAGATFMAIGSSVDELVTSIIDALNTKNNIGIGTIVGSSMFNLLVIIALSAAVAKNTINLDWRPLARDVSFYLVSVVLLFLLMVNKEVAVVRYEGESEYSVFDQETHKGKVEANITFEFGDKTFGQIDALEASVMMVLYGFYILFMVFNRKIFANCATATGDEEVFQLPSDKRHSIRRSIETFGEPSTKLENEVATRVMDNEERGTNIETISDSGSNSSLYSNPLEWPENTLGQIWFVITFPITLVCFLTIPNPENERYERLYPLSFIITVAWIGATCYLIIDMATKIGCILEIDPVIMGILVVAPGTGVSDALSSAIVARQGYGDMAISNAIGSNVFDILVGLGLPWVISNAVFGEPVLTNNSDAAIGVLIVLGTIVLFVAILVLNGFKMNSRLGWACVSLYGVYVAYYVVDSKCYIPAISPNCKSQ